MMLMLTNFDAGSVLRSGATILVAFLALLAGIGITVAWLRALLSGVRTIQGTTRNDRLHRIAGQLLAVDVAVTGALFSPCLSLIILTITFNSQPLADLRDVLIQVSRIFWFMGGAIGAVYIYAGLVDAQRRR